MPKIKLSNGYFHYKTIPLYAGVKQINKDIAYENLVVLKEVLDKQDVEFQISFGTLLGAIRENDFITHDEDVDLLVLDEYKQKLFDSLPELKKRGFDVARYDPRGLMSIYRKNEYIDFYLYKKKEDGTRYCCGSFYPCEMVEKSMPYSFKGLEVRIPVEYINYLCYEYGDDWQTPVVWMNYEQPKIKRILLAIKSVVKEWLPDSLYIRMAKASELKMYKEYEKKWARYKNSKC